MLRSAAAITLRDIRRHSTTAILRHIRRLSTTTTDPDNPLEIGSLSQHDPIRRLSTTTTIDPDKPLEIDLLCERDTIRHLAKSHRFSEIVELLESKKTEPNVTQEPFLCAIIHAYGLSGMFDNALKTYHQKDELGTPRTSHSFNTLLTACHNCKLFRDVPKIFEEIIQQYGVVPDEVSYGILVKSFCKRGQPEKALQILKHVEEKNVVGTSAVSYTTVLDTLYRKNRDEAEKVWSLMKAKNIIDVPAYNVRIKHVSDKIPGKVKALIAEMVDQGLKPNIVTYHFLITCYFNSRMTKEAMKVYAELGENGCHPDAMTFDTVVYKLCVYHDFREAHEIFKQSVELNMLPKALTLKALLEGLMPLRDMEEAVNFVEEGFRSRTAGQEKQPNTTPEDCEFEVEVEESNAPLAAGSGDEDRDEGIE